MMEKILEGSLACFEVPDLLTFLNERSRGARHDESAAVAAGDAPRRCSPSWARPITKVYEVDPLTCVRCGKQVVKGLQELRESGYEARDTNARD